MAALASRRLGRLAIGHPFPSTLVALLAGGLVLVAGGDAPRALLVGVAMAGFQVSIGAANDLADRALDAVAKPWKPLPAGRIGESGAHGVALAGFGLGAVLSALAGPVPLLVGLTGYGLGLAYDVRLKRAGWGPLAFALALPLIPVYAWAAAGAGLPPRLGLIIPLAVLAGLQLALANELADLDADAVADGRGWARRLGRRRAVAVMLAAAVAVLVLAWLTLPGATGTTLGALIAATVATAAGAAASARGPLTWRWLGWGAQALGLALLALAWISALRA
ncbi:MAG: UbiA family prenyltransferase [Candidatus Limnocylindrales bacterium]